MQVGNFILSSDRQPWDLSNMAEAKTVRGKALYDALMAIKPKDLTETEWAVKAGVNRGFFSNLKKGDSSPRVDNLEKILGFIGATEQALVKGGARYLADADSLKQHAYYRPSAKILKDHSGANPIVHVPGDGEVVQIQKLDLSLSMGPGTLIDGYVESELVSFDLNFVRLFTRAPSDRLRLVTGIGDSMEPTLRWGDLILIDANDRALTKQDGIYWINLYGAAGIKRLRAIGPNKILVKSDNPIHDDQEVDAEDLRIEGRAIWATRGL